MPEMSSAQLGKFVRTTLRNALRRISQDEIRLGASEWHIINVKVATQIPPSANLRADSPLRRLGAQKHLKPGAERAGIGKIGWRTCCVMLTFRHTEHLHASGLGCRAESQQQSSTHGFAGVGASKRAAGGGPALNAS